MKSFKAPSMSSVVVLSKAVVLLLILIYCGPIVLGGIGVLVLVLLRVFSVLSSFAIISLRKKKLVALLL